jgi:hypothetical protein
MSDTPDRWRLPLLNVSIGLAVLVVLVLGYGLVTRMLNPPVLPERAENPAGLQGEVIQVELRNGCGVPGVVAAARLFLIDRGFDVVETGNWSRFDVEQTRVIDRSGDREAALRVAAALGLAPDRVEADPRPLFVDVTVVIGRDYQQLCAFQP